MEWSGAGWVRAGTGRAVLGKAGQVVCSGKDLRISSLWNPFFFMLRIAQSWPTITIIKIKNYVCMFVCMYGWMDGCV